MTASASECLLCAWRMVRYTVSPLIRRSSHPVVSVALTSRAHQRTLALEMVVLWHRALGCQCKILSSCSSIRQASSQQVVCSQKVAVAKAEFCEIAKANLSWL